MSFGFGLPSEAQGTLMWRHRIILKSSHSCVDLDVKAMGGAIASLLTLSFPHPHSTPYPHPTTPHPSCLLTRFLFVFSRLVLNIPPFLQPFTLVCFYHHWCMEEESHVIDLNSFQERKHLWIKIGFLHLFNENEENYYLVIIIIQMLGIEVSDYIKDYRQSRKCTLHRHDFVSMKLLFVRGEGGGLIVVNVLAFFSHIKNKNPF